jgi:hypothetical protein
MKKRRPYIIRNEELEAMPLSYFPHYRIKRHAIQHGCSAIPAEAIGPEPGWVIE